MSNLEGFPTPKLKQLGKVQNAHARASDVSGQQADFWSLGPRGLESSEFVEGAAACQRRCLGVSLRGCARGLRDYDWPVQSHPRERCAKGGFLLGASHLVNEINSQLDDFSLSTLQKMWVGYCRSASF